MTTNKMSLPRHEKEIKKVKKLRKKKLSFRQISKLMDKDIHQVFRWANY